MLKYFYFDHNVHKTFCSLPGFITQHNVDTKAWGVRSLCNVNVKKGRLYRQDVSQAVCSAGLNGRVVSSVYNILSVSDRLDWHTVHSGGGGSGPRGD